MAEFIGRWFTPSKVNPQKELAASYTKAVNESNAANAAATAKQQISPAVIGLGKARAAKKTQTAYAGLLGGAAETQKKVLLGQ